MPQQGVGEQKPIIVMRSHTKFRNVAQMTKKKKEEKRKKKSSDLITSVYMRSLVSADNGWRVFCFI